MVIMCSVFFEAFRMRLNIIALVLHFYCTLDYRSSLQMNRGKGALSCTAQWASYCFLFCTLKHPDFATTVIGSQQHCTLRLLHCLICTKNYVFGNSCRVSICFSRNNMKYHSMKRILEILRNYLN